MHRYNNTENCNCQTENCIWQKPLKKSGMTRIDHFGIYINSEETWTRAENCWVDFFDKLFKWLCGSLEQKSYLGGQLYWFGQSSQIKRTRPLRSSVLGAGALPPPMNDQVCLLSPPNHAPYNPKGDKQDGHLPVGPFLAFFCSLSMICSHSLHVPGKHNET